MPVGPRGGALAAKAYGRDGGDGGERPGCWQGVEGRRLGARWWVRGGHGEFQSGLARSGPGAPVEMPYGREAWAGREARWQHGAA